MSDINPNWAQELAQKFAPTIVFHKEDKYEPCSVKWFLERCRLQPANGSIVDSLTLEDLKHHNHEKSRLILKNKEDRLGCLESATVYVHLRNAPAKPTDNEAYYDLQYWVFYPFNGGIIQNYDIGHHEGDWEHITVRVKDVFTKPMVYEIFYSAHGKGVWRKPAPGEKFPRKFSACIDDAQRPVVFASKHSHAFYEAQGFFPRLLIFRDKTNQGKFWETKDCLEIISDSLTPKYLDRFQKKDASIARLKTHPAKVNIADEHITWMTFKGVWGKQKSSPIGPIYKEAWEDGRKAS